MGQTSRNDARFASFIPTSSKSRPGTRAVCAVDGWCTWWDYGDAAA